MLPEWLPSPRVTENYVRLPSDQKDNQNLQTKGNSSYGPSGRLMIGIDLTPPSAAHIISPGKRIFYFLSNTELQYTNQYAGQYTEAISAKKGGQCPKPRGEP
jgi:hypothetical protein